MKLLLLLWSSLVFAATGDVTAVRVLGSTCTTTAQCDGWAAEIDITQTGVGGNPSTGGTYDFGLGANNDPTSAKVVFTVTSAGYDDTGASQNLVRTVYGTNFVRKVYPNNASADETATSGTLTIRVALSDWIYSSDTATVTIASGLYTQSAVSNNAVTGLSVTNGSTQAYPRVLGNWSWPGYSRITGSTFTVRAVAFHRSAQQGRPVRAVVFSCADQNSHTATATVTTPTIDSSLNDAVPVIEYIGTISTSSLTQGDILTCNFAAYPWYGDSGAVLNTADGVNSNPSPLYSPQTYRLDKTGAWGSTVAVVSPSGNDGTGAAIDSASFDSGSPPAAFLTIKGAADAIAAYNNTNRSRNNTGGAVIYLQEGTYVWTGGTIGAGGLADSGTWVTVTKFPGTSRSNVIIGSAATSKRIAKHVRLLDVSITNSTSIGIDGLTALWIDQCDVNTSAAATIYINTVTYFTASRYWNTPTILSIYSTVNSSRSLIRGNAFQTADSNGIRAHVILGNSILSTGNGVIGGDYSGQTAPTMSNNMVVAYNRMSQTSATSPAVVMLQTTLTTSFGFAVVQNVFERVTGSSPSAVQIAADSTTGTPVNNVLFWHNTVVGQRANLAYNDYILNGGSPAYRRNWHIVGSIFDDINIVTDIDAHGGTPDGARYGNHGPIHGAGLVSNVQLERCCASGYTPKFAGIGTYATTSGTPGYVDDESLTVAGAGNGDYRLTAASPARSLIRSGTAVLPFDISGAARRNDGTGAAGAYEFGSPFPSAIINGRIQQ